MQFNLGGGYAHHRPEDIYWINNTSAEGRCGSLRYTKAAAASGCVSGRIERDRLRGTLFRKTSPTVLSRTIALSRSIVDRFIRPYLLATLTPKLLPTPHTFSFPELHLLNFLTKTLHTGFTKIG